MEKKESVKISFFRDILNRRVPQIVGLYMAIAWGLIQFIIWLVDEFVLSPYLPQFTFVILLTMLPTVIIVAYFHGKPGRDSWTKIEKIGISINVVLTATILISFFQGKELGAVEKKITVLDETGKKIERAILKNQFRKKLVIFTFENSSDDSTINWLQNGIPYLIQFDLSQEMNMDVQTFYDFVEKIKQADFPADKKLPLPLMLTIARNSGLNFILTGSFLQQNDQYEILAKIYEVKNGKIYSENSYTGKNIFNIVDNITVQLKKDFHIPIKHLENTKDLPVAEILTSSLPAYKNFIMGRNSQRIDNDYSKAIHLLENACSIDPIFSIANMELFSHYIQSNHV